jgi:hypothetical protein
VGRPVWLFSSGRDWDDIARWADSIADTLSTA